ncbi:hypothetical protein [Streptomyces sp. NPDC020681]|uniref:hypothetical protein n=1 Tax=Streptomyces sp. NPDC020681 TaxID=3365083 RepID=UPI0037894A23
MLWHKSANERGHLSQAFPAGAPIPEKFLGTRQAQGWTVTVQAETVGSAAVTGIGDGDFSGRHCEWSAVVLVVSPYKYLRTAPAQLDPTRSDPGCKAPQGPLVYWPAGARNALLKAGAFNPSSSSRSTPGERVH